MVIPFIFLLGNVLAYSVSSTLGECERCQLTNKNVCWDQGAGWQGDSGQWGTSYCCGSSDVKCNDYLFCSNKVSSTFAKKMSCPVDEGRCPSGGSAVIQLSQQGGTVQRSSSWKRFSIRSDTLCKYRIKYQGPAAPKGLVLSLLKLEQS